MNRCQYPERTVPAWHSSVLGYLYQQASAATEPRVPSPWPLGRTALQGRPPGADSTGYRAQASRFHSREGGSPFVRMLGSEQWSTPLDSHNGHLKWPE